MTCRLCDCWYAEFKHIAVFVNDGYYVSLLVARFRTGNGPHMLFDDVSFEDAQISEFLCVLYGYLRMHTAVIRLSLFTG